MTLPASKPTALIQQPKRHNRCSCWCLYILNNMSTTGILLPITLLLILQLTMMSSYVNAQDYYFSNPNTQNRFVPSSQYQNTRTFSRGISSPAAISPGSYQEQLLFIGNENKQPQNQPLTSAAYTPFGQQYTNTRNTDYYEISPRPFGTATGSASANTYTRSKSFKPSSSFTANSGFVPQRVNVPHQQTQFLQHFNEPTVDKPSSSNRLSASTGFGSSPARPFGNGGYSPNSNRNRPSANNYNADAPVGPQASQQVPFRNTRNRFQPSSATTATTTSTTTTDLPTSSRRYNRFGGRTQNLSSNGFRASTQTTTHSNSPESSRKTAKSGNRRPAFISREVNEPIQVNKQIQKNYAHKQERVKLPLKNKIFKQQVAASSTPFRPSLLFSTTEESDSLNDEYEETPTENEDNKVINSAMNEPILEKLQLQEAEIKPPLMDNTAKSTKIKATNLEMETNANENTEEVHSHNSANNSQSEELQNSDDNDDEEGGENYSDEYSQEESQDLEKESKEAATVGSLEENIQTTEKPLLKEEKVHTKEENKEQILKASVTLVTETTTSNKQEEPQVITTTEAPLSVAAEKVTATVLMTTTESSGDKEEHHNDEESSADYDEEDYEEESGDEESGDDVENEEDGEQEDSHEHEGSAQSLDHLDEALTTINSLVTTTTLEPSPLILDREVVSVVTTKSVINGSTAFPSPVTSRSTTLSLEEEAIFTESKISPASDESSEETDLATTPIPKESNDESINNTTEGYVVVASIQTSRSINGARFLSFPAIQQEESKKFLSELERKPKGKLNKNSQDSNSEQIHESEEMEPNTPTEPESSSEQTTSSQVSSSTESIIDKLDRVQSELSSGLLAGKYPIISQMGPSTPSTTSTSGNKFIPNIRKFQPKSTAAPKVKAHQFDEPSAAKVKVHHIDETEMDELASLLPDGFKRTSYKNRKITTTTTTTTTRKPQHEIEYKKPLRNSTISRSFKNTPVAQNVSLAGLLPKGYKLPSTTENPKNDLQDILSKIKFDDNLDKLLPKDYKNKASTAKPAVTLVNDLSKFLPPGYKLTTTPTTPLKQQEEDKEESILSFSRVTAAEPDDITKFLPPGYKLRTTRKPLPKIEPEAIDVSQLLPKDYKSAEEVIKKPEEILKKIEFKEVASLLPPGFQPNSSEDLLPQQPAVSSTTSTTTPKPNETTNSDSSTSLGSKLVFPKGIHKRKGAIRLTTPRTSESGENKNMPGSPPVVVRKGPPVRASTEFTGWPTPSTTPISIERLLEQAKTATINFEDLLLPSSTSTSTTTTSTTTTTTTTPKPTKPGFCTADCDLAATIKIIDGVSWKPELLDHNTAEWKNLAREVEAQLNEVYSSAPQLNKWYKKVRIDSFSKGSVLVDYYVELANVTQDVNTLEIKTLFHKALTPQAMLPQKSETENETDNDDAENSSYQDIKEEKLVKETFVMGKYVIDPVATDFSVIPKSLTPNVEFAEEDLLIPQWAIVVIVIGVGSLVFVVIFGITVLLNRHNHAKKTPTPLTNDMLNELKINHMGGVENYGVDDFYNIDDAWNDTKQPIKPKRFTNSTNEGSNSNIYDSWRSTRHGDYYYDGHNHNNYASQKGDSLQRSLKHHPHSQYSNHSQHQQSLYGGHQYPDAFADAHQMYTYNNQPNSRSSRYPRDYDPDF